MGEIWGPESWRGKPAKHIPEDYPDAQALSDAGGGEAVQVFGEADQGAVAATEVLVESVAEPVRAVEASTVDGVALHEVQDG